MRSLRRALVLMLVAVVLAALPAAAQSSGKKIEITLYGGFSLASGTGTASDNPSDLFTGKWSPFFATGYNNFGWSANPNNLDAVIGSSILGKKSGPQFGIKLGFRVNPRIQIEGFFEYSLAKTSFTEEAWGDYEAVTEKAMSSLTSAGRNPSEEDLSISKAGKAMNFGLNLNFDLAAQGMVIPYLSVGGFASMISGLPYLDYAVTQRLGASSATYGFMVDYADFTAIGFGGGLGARIYMGKDMGLKIEARANYMPIKAEQRFEASFSRVGTTFITYNNYDKIAAVEKFNHFVITLNAGFFFGL